MSEARASRRAVESPDGTAPRYGGFTDNDRALHALMVTYFHWGVHGWVPYVVIGALLGLMAHRRGLLLRWN